MPPLKRLHPTNLFADTGYAYARLAPSGSSFVFAAGACPIDENGVVVARADVRAQAALAVHNLEAVLSEVGCSLSDVVRTTVYVATSDRRELVAGWEAVRAAFLGADPPSTLVGVSLLGYNDQLIEVEAVAVSAQPVES
ncbi:MAG: RidA family protein [Acidimicrobiales bacterium]